MIFSFPRMCSLLPDPLLWSKERKKSIMEYFEEKKKRYFWQVDQGLTNTISSGMFMSRSELTACICRWPESGHGPLRWLVSSSFFVFLSLSIFSVLQSVLPSFPISENFYYTLSSRELEDHHTSEQPITPSFNARCHVVIEERTWSQTKLILIHETH